VDTDNVTLLYKHFKTKENKTRPTGMLWAGITQSVERLATYWMVRRSNPCEGELFFTPPDRLLVLRSLLYNGYRVSFPGVKMPGRGVDHPPQSSAEVEEKLGLYIYSPSGPSWPVLGRNLLLLLC